MGLVDAGGAAHGADEFVALEQPLLHVRPTEVARLLLLVLLLLGVVVVVARRVLRLNITDTRMAVGVVVHGGCVVVHGSCFLLHRPGCVGCVEAFFYVRAARSFRCRAEAAEEAGLTWAPARCAERFNAVVDVRSQPSLLRLVRGPAAIHATSRRWS